jgi:1,4-alpha-glucan branching enzyme
MSKDTSAGVNTTPHSQHQPHPGMGAIVHDAGVAFRVWAPHATAVAVVGSFNDWKPDQHPMTHDADGYWYADVASAAPGDEYRFHLVNGDREFSRIDPYAREVTNSVGNAVVHDPYFDWGDDRQMMPPWNEAVIYELHIGTFGRAPGEHGDAPASFHDALTRFEHLKTLGVNVLQVMPAVEFAGDVSWGYNPAHIFAIESAYGGPRAFKHFVREAHRAGFAVVLDVVYNHFGPSDLDLWQFDGWSEHGMGGIYFYNDWRASTPWGDTRPDYGRPEVRQFIHDNAMMWLDDYHVDGLRFDMTLYMRAVHADGTGDLPDGWSLAQWINGEIRQRYPGRITIAEDLQNNEWLTRAVGAGGAGYSAQWDANFVHPVRGAVIATGDEHRSMDDIHAAITHRYNGDAFQRVIYSESHDEVANGKARVPSEINADDPAHWLAVKRSTLAAALVFTAPGIPMIFQGQEFLQGGWFEDTVPLEWDKTDTYRGILRLYRDLIALRRNVHGTTRGLTGHGLLTYHVNDSDNFVAFHRWAHRGPGDDVVVLANFAHTIKVDYQVGFPAAGDWHIRLNSSWRGYHPDFTDVGSPVVEAEDGDCDGLPASGRVQIGPYSVLVLSQQPD